MRRFIDRVMRRDSETFIVNADDPLVFYYGRGRWGTSIAEAPPASHVDERPDDTLLVKVTTRIIRERREL